MEGVFFYSIIFIFGYHKVLKERAEEVGYGVVYNPGEEDGMVRVSKTYTFRLVALVIIVLSACK